jgi:hypothetical protein
MGVAATYTLKTTGQTITISGAPPTGGLARPYLAVGATGELKIWAPVSATPKQGDPAFSITNGTFNVLFADGVFALKGSGRILLMGVSLTLNLDMQVYFKDRNPGLVARSVVTVSLNFGPGKLRGSGELLVNTRQVSGSAGGVAIDPQTVVLRISGGARGGVPLIDVSGLKIYGTASFLLQKSRIAFEVDALMDLYLVQLNGGVSGNFETLPDGTVLFNITATLGFRIGSAPEDAFATYVQGEIEAGVTSAGTLTGAFAGSGAIAGVMIGTIRGGAFRRRRAQRSWQRIGNSLRNRVCHSRFARHPSAQGGACRHERRSQQRICDRGAQRCGGDQGSIKQTQKRGHCGDD